MRGGSHGKTALVTGGASGLGQAFALRLADDGANVVIADLQSAAGTVEAITREGGRAISVPCDISDPHAVERLGKMLRDEFGKCDILVNNAGIAALRPFAEVTFEQWRRVMAVNLDAMFLLSSMFARDMTEQKWGRIINIASNTVAQVISGFAPYIASKAGVIGLTRALATELGADDVTVNAIAPGLTRTPQTESQQGLRGMSAEDAFKAVASRQAIRKTGVPADYVGLVSFLASEELGYITGQTFYVDGGLVRS